MNDTPNIKLQEVGTKNAKIKRNEFFVFIFTLPSFVTNNMQIKITYFCSFNHRLFFSTNKTKNK